MRDLRLKKKRDTHSSLFAIKVMEIEAILKHKHVDHVLQEGKTLRESRHPFVVGLDVKNNRSRQMHSSRARAICSSS